MKRFFPRRQPSHEHDLHVTGIQAPHARLYSVLLFGCRTCTHTETVPLDGDWSIEQLARLRSDDNGKLYDPGPDPAESTEQDDGA